MRRSLDPIQASLIAAHVTLCREDEIEGIAACVLLRRIENWNTGPITLVFGHPVRFNGHGVLMPCQRGAGDFNRLRQWLLQPQSPREHAAHITLAHPRNPRPAGNTDSALRSTAHELELQFASVALIEQHGSAPWKLVQQATLGSNAYGVA